MTTRAQHKSDPIGFEDLQNSYAARKLRKKSVEILQKNCNFRKLKFKLSSQNQNLKWNGKVLFQII